MQLLQFAEPIEKSRVIYFDRRPESSRHVNQTNQFPKTLYDKKLLIQSQKKNKKCNHIINKHLKHSFT